MPRQSSRSADGLLAEIREMVRAEMQDALRPSIQKMVDAASELQSAFRSGTAGAGARPGRRRGRPPGKAAAKPAKTRGRRKGGKRAPRGALKNAVQETLANSPTPLKISEIRDCILSDSTFAKRNPKTIYAQVVHSLNRIPEAKRTSDGRYTISRRGGGRRRKAGAEAAE